MSPGGAGPPALTDAAVAGSVGIDRVDRALGPLPVGSTFLVLHDAGIDAAPFLHHLAHRQSRLGRRIVFAISSREPGTVLGEAQRLGLEVADPVVADLRGAADLDEVSRRIAEARGDRPGSVLLVGFNGLLQSYGLRTVQDWWSAWRPTSRADLVALNVTTIAPGVQDWMAPQRTLHLQRREIQGVRYDTVETQRDARSGVQLPYRVERPGGVRLALPKILITGPHSAGKSTLVKTLSEVGVNVELLGTTVALDHGRLEHQGLVVDIFGTPGQERFEPIIRQAALGALGVLVVLDSTRPNTFLRGLDLARLTSQGGVPVVYVANKQDIADASSTDAVRARLMLPSEVPIVACVASDRTQALRALETLTAEILRPTRA